MTAHARAGFAAKYHKVQVKTCSPAQLVLLLHDGILRFAAEAEQAIDKKDRARACERIGRCHAIFQELAATLDPTHAPELCANLSGLYTFCMGRLLEANLAQSKDMLAEVVRVVRPLREGWAEILEKT